MRTLEVRGVHVRLKEGELVSHMDSGAIPLDMMSFIDQFKELIVVQLQCHEGEREPASPDILESITLLGELDEEQNRVERLSLEAQNKPTSPDVLESITRLRVLDDEQAQLVQRLALEAKRQAQPAATLPQPSSPQAARPPDTFKITKHARERRLKVRELRLKFLGSVRPFLFAVTVAGLLWLVVYQWGNDTTDPGTVIRIGQIGLVITGLVLSLLWWRGPGAILREYDETWKKSISPVPPQVIRLTPRPTTTTVATPKSNHSDGLTPVNWFWLIGITLLVMWGWSKLAGGNEQSGVGVYCEQEEGYMGQQSTVCYGEDEPGTSQQNDEWLNDARAAAEEDRESSDSRSSRPGHVDCNSFGSQGEAQRFFEDNGGPMFDPYWLDGDNDGIACEWN